MKLNINEDGAFYKKFYNNWNSLGINFNLICASIENDDLEEAYNLASVYGGMTRDLTLYLINDHFYPFKFNPLQNMDYVPENFLYEYYDKNLVIHLDDDITKIKDHAFHYCTLKKLVIPKSIKYVGDYALCLNGGEIEYKGTKQEFIDLIFGKSKCFCGTMGQIIKCSDGDIEIKK